MSYQDSFAEARKRFRLVGVLGMSYSGVNVFMTEVFKRKMLVARSMNDSPAEVASRMIQQGNKWLTLNLQNRNVTWQPKPDGSHEFNTVAAIEAGLQDRLFYEKFMEQSWETKIENQCRRLDFLCNKYPDLSAAQNIPIFVELPMSAAINNYNDLVQELVVIKRPRGVDPSTWYYKNLESKTQAYPVELTVSNRIDHIESDDKYFDRLNYTANAVIENYGTNDEYIAKVNEYLDATASVTVVALQTYAPQRWEQE